MLFSFFICTSKEKPLKIVQVQDSILYAPQYIAISKNYFKEEHINIQISKVDTYEDLKQNILSKKSDIMLSSIYIPLTKNTNMVCLGQVGQKECSFLVSSKSPLPISSVTNSTIYTTKDIVSTSFFKYFLLKNNISFNDSSFNYSKNTTNSPSLSLIKDYELLNSKDKNIILFSGAKHSYIPYMVYSSLSVTANKKFKNIQGLSNAINKSLMFIQIHNSKEIASILKPYFKNYTLKELTKIVQIYKDNNVWCESTDIEKNNLDYMIKVINLTNNLKFKVNYNKFILNI